MNPQMVLRLDRIAEEGNNTIGILRFVHMHSPTIWTCEDLWRDNKRNVSCIPAGTYTCVPHGWEPNSPHKFKKVWRVTNVPGRSAVLIHAGNDHTDTEGCILPGFGHTSGFGVTRSRDAIDYLRKTIGEKSFRLIVKDDMIN